MAPDPQVLEQIYTEKGQLAPGRAAALAGLTYAETVLDIYGGTSANLTDSASTHLSRALASLTYLDQVRQRSSYTEAANDPRYLADNSREQASQLTVLAQTDIAITKATQYGHTDTVNILVGLKNSFEAYSTRVGEICAREQDEDSPYASPTASPANPEARPTQPPPSAGPAYLTAPAEASAATNAARSYKLTNQRVLKDQSRLRNGETAVALNWIKDHMPMVMENYGNNPPDRTAVNLFRAARGEIEWGGRRSKTEPEPPGQYQQETEGRQLARQGDYSKATFADWRAIKFPDWRPETSLEALRAMGYPSRPRTWYEEDRAASLAHNAGRMANAPQIPQLPQNPYPQNPAGPYASLVLPPQGYRQGTTQAGPATHQPPRNPYQEHAPHGPAR
ncbi:hypothetical protein ABT030_46630 [Streptomyces mirabilis]|uniref:hypothetical protein n=1 Tax=Streptomyces mirabilis TaxID=68239 RepID=UPI00331655A7